ncbi:MAG: phage tail tape measure protein [Deltaproteobacteria bacterium]|nr:phage tail tape measure protein [Deltaproteobacteria bacterium]
MAQPIGSLRAELSAGHAQFSADMRKAKNAVQKNATGMQKAMHKVGDKFTRAAKAMTSFRGIMAGTAMVAGMVYAIKKNLEYADSIAKTADSIGISTKALQQWRYIADRSGVSTDQLDKALNMLAVRTGKLQAGTGTLYTYLNKTNEALLGQFKAAGNSSEAFDIFFEAVEKLEDPLARLAFAEATFGMKLGPRMLLLAGNTDTLRDRFERLGLEIDEDLLRGAEKAKDNIDDLSAVIKVSLISAISSVGPELGKAAAGMAQWVADNNDFITQDMPAKINAMKDSLGDIKDVYDDIPEEITGGVGVLGAALFGKKIAVIVAAAMLLPKIARTLKGFGAVSEGSLDFLEFATMNAKELKAALDAISDPFAGGVPGKPSGATRGWDLDEPAVGTGGTGGGMVGETPEEAAARLAAETVAAKLKEAVDKQIESLKVQRDTFGMASKEVALYHLRMQGATPEQLKLAEAILDTTDNMKAYAATDEAIIDMMADIDEGTKASIKSLEDLADTTEEKSDVMEQAFVGWGNSFSSTLNDMLWGSETTFEAIAESFAQMVTQMLIQKYLIEKMFGKGGGGGWFGITLKAVGTALGGSKLFSAKGNAFEGGNLLPFAKGGIVSLPTVFPMAQGAGLMGEDGPEAVMPLKRTSSGDLGVVSNGGGTTIIINAIDSKSFSEVVKRNPGSIVTVVNDALENRSGLLDTIRGTI